MKFKDSPDEDEIVELIVDEELFPVIVSCFTLLKRVAGSAQPTNFIDWWIISDTIKDLRCASSTSYWVTTIVPSLLLLMMIVLFEITCIIMIKNEWLKPQNQLENVHRDKNAKKS